MKVLIVYSDLRCSCTIKCTFELAEALSHYCVCKTIFFKDLREKHYREFDFIILQRLGGNNCTIPEEFIQLIKKCKEKYPNKLFYYIDDMLQNNTIKKFVELADYYMFSNVDLNNVFNSENKFSILNGTFINTKLVDSIPALNLKNDKVKIIWASTGMMGRDLMKDILPRLYNKFGDKIQIFAFGGIRPDEKYPKEVIRRPIVPLITLIPYFKMADICMAPITNLLDKKFIDCKSELKYAYSSTTKTVFVGGEMASYKRAVKNGENGFILKNNVNDWIDCVGELVENKELRDKITENAYKNKEYYSLKKFGERVFLELNRLKCY